MKFIHHILVFVGLSYDSHLSPLQWVRCLPFGFGLVLQIATPNRNTLHSIAFQSFSSLDFHPQISSHQNSRKHHLTCKINQINIHLCPLSRYILLSDNRIYGFIQNIPLFSPSPTLGMFISIIVSIFLENTERYDPASESVGS